MANPSSPSQGDRAALPDENAAQFLPAMQCTNWLAVQLLRGLADHAALIARARKLVGGGLTLAVAAGDRGRAVGRAAGDVIDLHLAGEAVVQANDGHAEMQQVGDDREQRGLLA